MFYSYRRLIHVDDNAMVLEDLNYLNFKPSDRKQRLQLNEIKLVLNKLAKFHALNAVAISQDRDLMKHHMTNMYELEDNPMNFFFMISCMETIDAIKDIPELQKYAEFLSTYDMAAKEKEVFQIGPTETFHMLTHGELIIIFFH